ncbi:MAG: GrpB family protein [Oscillospiraceae bacterium]|nr:GrpB family protein [Oscillospiraceae bacterium]MBQ6902665.1 GrpB family protein [Oscillospiraceae bacterium]
MEGVKRYKVELREHNEAWELEFKATKTRIKNILPEKIIDIQHVGSTAIPSICAKPILDIAILLKDIDKEVIEKLVAIGYDYRGPREDNGNYYLFVLRGPGEISLHHLHCYDQSGKGFEQLVAFRDYMNTHEECAVSYNELKKSLAEKHKENRAVYTLSKAEFIQSVYDKISEEKNMHKLKDMT